MLIFEMAVALDFDAPRAWALVSMRANRSEDFGMQFVGHVLRMHRRLQGACCSNALEYGCVLLANTDVQGSIDAVRQWISRVQAQFTSVSPTARRSSCPPPPLGSI